MYYTEDYERDATRFYNQTMENSSKGISETLVLSGLAVERLSIAIYKRYFKEKSNLELDFVHYIESLDQKKAIPKQISIKIHGLRRVSNLAKHTPAKFGKDYLDSCRLDLNLVFSWYQKKYKKVLDLDQNPYHINKSKPTTNHKVKNKNPNHILKGLEKPPIIDSQKDSFIEDLYDLGIIGTLNSLSDSKFRPIQCMQNSHKSLFFMGILGSKWIKEIKEFRKFLVKMQANHGQVRFLMINPFEESFNLLKTMRGEHLKDNSTKVFKDLIKEFPCLQARYYNFLPCFRLIFIDNEILVSSRYKLDKDNYLKSNKGWEAPHLIMKSNTKTWSLYHPFLYYYNKIWGEAIELK